MTYHLKPFPKTNTWRLLTPLGIPVLPSNIGRHITSGAAVYYVKPEALFLDEKEQARLAKAYRQMYDWGARFRQAVLVSVTGNESSPLFDEISYWMTLGGVGFSVSPEHVDRFFESQLKLYAPQSPTAAIARAIPGMKDEDKYGLLRGDEPFTLIEVLQYLAARSASAREFLGIPDWAEMVDYNLLAKRQQQED